MTTAALFDKPCSASLYLFAFSGGLMAATRGRPSQHIDRNLYNAVAQRVLAEDEMGSRLYSVNNGYSQHVDCS